MMRDWFITRYPCLFVELLTGEVWRNHTRQKKGSNYFDLHQRHVIHYLSIEKWAHIKVFEYATFVHCQKSTSEFDQNQSRDFVLCADNNTNVH